MADDRMFSQAELDQIVRDRLSKERVKYQAEANQRTAELDRRERLLSAKEDWSAKGLPVALLDVLDMSREDALEAAEMALGGITKKTEDNTSGPKFTKPMGSSSSAGVVDAVRAAFGLNHRKDE